MAQRSYTRIELNTTSKGIGIKLAGGKIGENQFGIFIKRIIPGGALSHYRKANVGDQIIDVNGIVLLDTSLSR